MDQSEDTLKSDFKIHTTSSQSSLWREGENGQYLPSSRFHERYSIIQDEKDKDKKTEKDAEPSLIKRNQKELHSQRLQPKQIAYHKKHKYVVLEKDNNVQALIDMGENADKSKLPNTWECSKYECDESDANGEAKSDNKKININPQELQFQISIEAICEVEKHISSTKNTVQITDNVSSLLQPMKGLYQSDFVAIENERTLDGSKTFAEENIRDGQKLFLYGIKANGMINSGNLKFFLRFSDFKQDSWSVGASSWDALLIKCSKRFYFMGIGIFERYQDPPIEFTLKYKYEIKEEDGTVVIKSEEFKETINYSTSDVNQLHFFKYQLTSFRNGIKVEAGQTLNFMQTLSFTKCYYSESGNSYETYTNPDMGIFQIKTSPNSSNSTELNRGIIPGFLYKLG